MKVKILEDSLKEEIDGEHKSFVKDDQVSVPGEVGERWCGLGWAEDVDGKVETAERKPGAQKIQPDNVVQTTAKN